MLKRNQKKYLTSVSTRPGRRYVFNNQSVKRWKMSRRYMWWYIRCSEANICTYPKYHVLIFQFKTIHCSGVHSRKSICPYIYYIYQNKPMKAWFEKSWLGKGDKAVSGWKCQNPDYDNNHNYHYIYIIIVIINEWKGYALSVKGLIITDYIYQIHLIGPRSQYRKFYSFSIFSKILLTICLCNNPIFEWPNEGGHQRKMTSHSLFSPLSTTRRKFSFLFVLNRVSRQKGNELLERDSGG